MTPQDKILPVQETEEDLAESPKPNEFALEPDDEPFELPPGYPEEAIALLRSW